MTPAPSLKGKYFPRMIKEFKMAQPKLPPQGPQFPTPKPLPPQGPQFPKGE